MQVKRTTPTQSLLCGRPYTPAAATDVVKTWLNFGWVPPSREVQQQAMQRLNPPTGGNGVLP
jgi:hypothetical protein